MTAFLQFALVTFTSVLFIVDPVAAVPAFLVVTQDEDRATRRRTALRASVAMALLLIGFAAAGRFIFRAFGITMPAFQVAGGLILWFVAADMLRAKRTTQESGEELAEGAAKEDVALTPLAMPILAGPGAISTAMVLVGSAQDVAHAAAVYGALVLTALVCWGTLLASEWLVAILGRTGIHVLTRIEGLLLAAMATQFVLSGIKAGLAP